MEILFRYRASVAEAMDQYLGGDPPSPLLQMSRYHLGFEELDGTPTTGPSGKMVRSAICLALCEALGGSVNACLPAATSLELIHRTSLLFDDIQDHSSERNHRPTVASAVGVDRAINVGLSLSCYARLAIHGLLAQGISPGQVLAVHELLETSVLRLCAGQDQDLTMGISAIANGQPPGPSKGQFKGRSTLRDYQEMVRLKTGALLATGCQIGALLADQNDQAQEAARAFGEALGLAFQFQDDYLGIWGNTQVVGKTANDLEQRKFTLPVVLGLEQDPSRRLFRMLTEPAELYNPEEVRHILEVLGVRQAAEQEVSLAAERASRALGQLDLEPEDLSQFEELVGFVATRVG